MRAFWVVSVGLILGMGFSAEALSRVRLEMKWIPVEEEISRLESLLEGADADMPTHYLLGQIYQQVYATNVAYFYVPVDPDVQGMWRGLNFPVSHSAMTIPVSVKRLEALEKSIVSMRAVVELEPEVGHGWIGLGYSYSMAAKRCNDSEWSGELLKDFEQTLSGTQGVRYWRNEALSAFRRAMEVSKSESESFYWAAQGMCQLLVEDTYLSPEEQEELVKLSQHSRHFPRRDLFHGAERLPGYVAGVPQSHVDEMHELYPAVPLAENGAEYFLLAIDAMVHLESTEQVPLLGEVQLNVPVRALSKDTIEATKLVLRAHEELLDLVHRGAGFSRFGYTHNFENGQALMLPEMSGLRGLARLVSLKSLMAAEEGRSADAQSALLDSFGVGKSLSNSPLVIGHLVHVAVTGINCSMMEQVVNRTRLSEDELLGLQDAMAALDESQNLRIACEGEKWMARIPVSEEQVLDRAESIAMRRVMGGMEVIDINLLPSSSEIEVSEEDIEVARDELNTEQQAWEDFTVAAHDELLAQLDKSVEALYAHYKEEYERGMDPRSRFQRPQFPGVARFVMANVRTQAKLRVSQTAIAIERYRRAHGEVPNELIDLFPEFIERETLTDPYSGNLLKIEQSEGQFVVYSIADKHFNDKIKSSNPNALSAISFSVYDKD